MSDWRIELAEKDSWADQESAKRWLGKLNTKRYADECLVALEIHVKETGKSPDQLIKERVQQLRDFDPRIRSKEVGKKILWLISRTLHLASSHSALNLKDQKLG